MTFEVGDVVYLRGDHSVKLTVEHFHIDEERFPEGLCSCLWFDVSGMLRRENFLPNTLIKVGVLLPSDDTEVTG